MRTERTGRRSQKRRGKNKNRMAKNWKKNKTMQKIKKDKFDI